MINNPTGTDSDSSQPIDNLETKIRMWCEARAQENPLMRLYFRFAADTANRSELIEPLFPLSKIPRPLLDSPCEGVDPALIPEMQTQLVKEQGQINEKFKLAAVQAELFDSYYRQRDTHFKMMDRRRLPFSDGIRYTGDVDMVLACFKLDKTYEEIINLIQHQSAIRNYLFDINDRSNPDHWARRKDRAALRAVPAIDSPCANVAPSPEAPIQVTVSPEVPGAIALEKKADSRAPADTAPIETPRPTCVSTIAIDSPQLRIVKACQHTVPADNKGPAAIPVVGSESYSAMIKRYNQRIPTTNMDLKEPVARTESHKAILKRTLEMCRRREKNEISESLDKIREHEEQIEEIKEILFLRAKLFELKHGESIYSSDTDVGENTF